jgi:hypothetical protein
MKFLTKLICAIRNFRRIRELENSMFISGDRRDWDAIDKAQKEIDQLRGNITLMSPKDKLEKEIRLVDRAIWRHEDKINDMQRAWQEAGAICCPGCMFGKDWSDLAGRKERAEQQLRKLLTKREKMLM